MSRADAKSRNGVYLILLSACGFGTGPLFIKLAFSYSIDVITLLAVRALFAWLVLAGVAALLHQRPTSPDKRLIALTLLFTAQNAVMFSAFSLAPVAPVMLIFYTHPMLIFILFVVLGRTRVTIIQGIAIPIVGIGLILLVSAPSTNDLPRPGLGYALAVGGSFLYSAYLLLGADISARISSLSAALVITSAAAVCFPFAWLLWGRQYPSDPLALLPVVGLTLLATALPLLALYEGNRRGNAARTGFLSLAEPVCASLLAFLFLHERLSIEQVIGAVAVLGGAATIAARIPIAQSSTRAPLDLD